MRELRNTKIIAVDAPEKEGINHAEQYPQHKPAILYDVSPFPSGHGNKRNKCSWFIFRNYTPSPPIRHPCLSGGLFEHRVQTWLRLIQNIKNF